MSTASGISTAAVIVAAGRGQRAGAGVPKQYLALAGRPVLTRTLMPFLSHPGIDLVRVVIHPDDRELYDAAVAGLDLAAPVAGGASRQESVLKGLESLSDIAPDVVLVHDAARPFVSHGVIDRVLEALSHTAAAIPGLRVADTVKRVSGGKIAQTLDRDTLWRAQTPQGFRFAEILTAHRAMAGRALTDDAAVAEAAGIAVAVVDGDEENMKITMQADIAAAERRLGAIGPGAASIRVGIGFDVHRFADGDKLMLCGVELAHERGLEGHSDADVGLHAITDAILGALGAGDIGAHFPPADSQWKGAPSWRFLDHARDLAERAGAKVAHLDVTLICERPKIGPHRAAMRARIADILRIAEASVNVKATTTERLGFLGRAEGIAAQAVATLEFGCPNRA